MPIDWPGDGDMAQAERFEILNGRKATTMPVWAVQDRIMDLPGVPVLAETLLKMELELHQSATDLRRFAEVVLGDIGAALQILRLAGQEYASDTDRPIRMEDCISALGPGECLNAVAQGSLLKGVRQQASVAMWSHSKEVAQYFGLFAAQASAGIRPDQAYLVGLLHTLGALPAILDWARYGISGDPACVAIEIAEGWRLPRFVRNFFTEVLMPGHSPEWAKFITVAHHPAKESWVDCPLNAVPFLAFS